MEIGEFNKVRFEFLKKLNFLYFRWLLETITVSTRIQKTEDDIVNSIFKSRGIDVPILFEIWR